MNTNKTYAEQIASEYAPKKESKVVALKKLDAKAKRPALIFAYTFGTIFALVLGLGMAFAMGSLKLFDNGTVNLVVGIIIGVVGLVGVGVNYPIYQKILASSKKKHAPDIQALAKEVVDENPED
ncbi:MAG: dihydropteridine reductase [Eubacteriales bacterium]|nr:dihydropteridine reductase [Eubacteriales bacterium]